MIIKLLVKWHNNAFQGDANGGASVRVVECSNIIVQDQLLDVPLVRTP